MDTPTFLAHLVQTARANLAYAADVRQAASEALQEAHSSLSQPDFFAALDALARADEALIDLIERVLQHTLTVPESPWGVSPGHIALPDVKTLNAIRDDFPTHQTGGHPAPGCGRRAWGIQRGVPRDRPGHPGVLPRS